MNKIVNEGISISQSLPSTLLNDSFYTLLVKSDNMGFDEVDRYITIDKVDNVSIQMTSDITSFPLLTGDTVSDHKYDRPFTINIGGVFGLNGKWKDTFTGSENRLKNIETYLEACKKLGKSITLIMQLGGENRFRERENLIIESLSFNYYLNTIKFNMTLKEVYYFEGTSDIELKEYKGDPNLPTLSQFQSLDFTEDVIGEMEITNMVVTALQDNGLIDQKFTEHYWQDFGKDLALQAVGAAATGVGIALAAIALANAWNPFGWVLVATAGGLAIVYSIIDFVEQLKKKAFIDAFTWNDEDELHNIKEQERFNNLVSSVQSVFDEISNNNDIKAYGFTSNINKQEMYLTIDDAIYAFDFERDANLRWNMRVTEIGQSEKEVELKGNRLMTGNRDVFELTRADALFTTKHHVSVYLINKAYIYNSLNDTQLETVLENAWKEGACGFLGYTSDYMRDNKDNAPIDELISRFKNDGIYKDLTAFELIVTDVDMGKLKEEMEKGIYNSLLKQQ